MRKISVSLNDEDYVILKEVAAAGGRTISGYLRHAGKVEYQRHMPKNELIKIIDNRIRFLLSDSIPARGEAFEENKK